ncbi:MAG: glycogen-binding domain-containing protein [Candidatus Omnitrophica bacterium]|nr:glycogen-binding domain-containing protein [Candidatus Omnitrophota bacterium]
MARKSASMKKTINFKLFAPTAKKVAVAGTFNNWNTDSLLAKRDTRGNWTAKISLPPGRYEYKFVVDNSYWIEDPNCKIRVPNSLGSQNCVIEVK